MDVAGYENLTIPGQEGKRQDLDRTFPRQEPGLCVGDL